MESTALIQWKNEWKSHQEYPEPVNYGGSREDAILSDS